jgi:hypothetical protein
MAQMRHKTLNALPAILQRRGHRRKVPSAALRVRVIGAEALLADGQGALVQGGGAVEVALGAQDAGEGC